MQALPAGSGTTPTGWGRRHGRRCDEDASSRVDGCGDRGHGSAGGVRGKKRQPTWPAAQRAGGRRPDAAPTFGGAAPVDSGPDVAPLDADSAAARRLHLRSRHPGGRPARGRPLRPRTGDAGRPGAGHAREARALAADHRPRSGPWKATATSAEPRNTTLALGDQRARAARDYRCRSGSARTGSRRSRTGRNGRSTPVPTSRRTPGTGARTLSSRGSAAPSAPRFASLSVSGQDEPAPIHRGNAPLRAPNAPGGALLGALLGARSSGRGSRAGSGARCGTYYDGEHWSLPCAIPCLR